MEELVFSGPIPQEEFLDGIEANFGPSGVLDALRKAHEDGLLQPGYYFGLAAKTEASNEL